MSKIILVLACTFISFCNGSQKVLSKGALINITPKSKEQLHLLTSILDECDDNVLQIASPERATFENGIDILLRPELEQSFLDMMNNIGLPYAIKIHDIGKHFQREREHIRRREEEFLRQQMGLKHELKSSIGVTAFPPFDFLNYHNLSDIENYFKNVSRFYIDN